MFRPRILPCFWLAALLPRALAAQNVITTIAGIDTGFSGNGLPAVSVPIGYINGVATDGAGNVYFTDPLEHLVLRVSTNGILSVIAGNGIAAYSGDGGPATSAAIAASDSPEQYAGDPVLQVGLGGIAVDPQGNVYFGDGQRVRRVATDGTITTVAGGGTKSPGDGGQATQASIGIVTGVALDSAGNLYFCENNRIRKVSPSGIVTTYAGTGTNGFSGDGGLATAARLSQPSGIAFDSQGNLYVVDGDFYNFRSRIRKINANGTISTIAGGGSTDPANGVSALNLDLSYASGVAVDAAGDIYVYAPYAGVLVELTRGSATLVTTTVATTFTTDEPAASAYVVGRRPYDNSGIALDSTGNLYVADSRDGRLCKIDTNGFFTTVAGNGTYGFGGDGLPAINALIQGPAAMTQTPDGAIYFLDTMNARVRAISSSGIINTVLGIANFPTLGNLEVLNGIASDPSGNLYILFAHRLLQLAPDGTTQYIIFGGGNNLSGPAFSTPIFNAGGLTRDAAGNLYVSDYNGGYIFKVTPDRKISAIAGNGKYGVSPDGSVAAATSLSGPTTLLPDNQGGLYFVEQQVTEVGGNVIRYITPDGHLKTIAGTAAPGFSGDGGPALNAKFMTQIRTGLALDGSGNLYIADGYNYRVRMVSPNGIISTFAGNGTPATAGDGGLATNASFFVPRGLLVDSMGDLLISDVAGNRIRSVLAAPASISVSPTTMAFSGKSNGSKTPAQQLAISGAIEGLAFSIIPSSAATWLTLDAASGATPQIIYVRADPTNLAPGTYSATLTITAPFGAPQNTNVAVTFQVAPGDKPSLAVDRTGVSFTFPRNPTTTLTEFVRVSNAGTGTLAFTAKAQAVTGGNWLSISPASGSVTPQTPARISVTANPQGLATGTYTGNITIASPAISQSFTVLVTLTVSSLDQAIQLSQAGLSFTAVAGGGVVPPESFGVSNIGRGTMNFTVSTSTLSGGSQWLSATPSSGAATSGAAGPAITVTVNQTNLAPGFYFGLVRVDSPTAANSPHVASVALRVLAAGQDPGPVISPNDIVVKAVQGDASPGSQNLFVYNISATPRSYVSHLASGNSKNKFQFIPETTMLSPAQPTRLVLQPLTSALPAGVYESTLTLQFSDGFIRRVGIRTVITPASATPSAAGASRPEASSDSVPSQLVPVITTLGQSFGVPAAWPVPIETQITDDCGNTLDAGSVKVAFSNGDPPLSLRSMQGGLWDTTWQSGNGSGAVTVTLTATDPTGTLTGVREVTGGLGDPSGAPVLAAAVSGASFAGNTPLAPGNIISLFGTTMANGSAAASAIPLTNTLAGASVVMAGVQLPMLYSSAGQINAVVSGGININTNQQVLVQRGNAYSIPISVDVGPSEPAIFAYPLPGDPPNQGAIVNALTYNVAQPGTPVTGGDILAIFCTGLGAVTPAVADGAGAPTSPLSTTVATPTVTVGGTVAKVTFSGLSPGFVGLYQIDAIVPSGLTPGNQVPVVITIAGQTSPPATIAVK